jgi:hypothetical protein
MVMYDKFAALALRLIDIHGRTFNLVRRSTIAADPTMPWRDVKGAGSKIAVVGVFAAVGFGRDQSTTTDSDVRNNRQTILIAAQSTALDLSLFDSIEDDDKRVYKIFNWSILKPGTTTILYSLEVYQ